MPGFESGQRYNSMLRKEATRTKIEQLTPGHYKYPFIEAAERSLAAAQTSQLEEVLVTATYENTFSVGRYVLMHGMFSIDSVEFSRTFTPCSDGMISLT